MTRLSFDPASGLLAADPALFSPAAPELARGPAGSFDQHLRRAREAVTPGAEPPPSAAESSGPARAEPETPGGDGTSPSSPSAEDPSRPTDDRDDEHGADRTSLPQESPATGAPASAGAIASALAQAPSEGRSKKADPVTDEAAAKTLEAKQSGPEHVAARTRPKQHAVSEATGQKTSSPGKQPAGKRTAQQVQPQEKPPAVQAEQPANEPDESQANVGKEVLVGVPAEAIVSSVVEPGTTGAGLAKKGKTVKETARQTGELAAAEAGEADSSAAAANPSLSLDKEGPAPAGNNPRTQAAERPARRSSSRPSARSPAASGAAKVVGGEAPAASDQAVADAEPTAPGGRQEARPDASVSPEPLAAAAERGQSEKVDAPSAKAEGDVARVQAAADQRSPPGAAPASPGASPTAPGAEQAERVRFVQRVARAFEAAADRGGTLRLRLHPPELGSLRLELSLRRGAMTARLETETEAARTMLLDNLPALRQRLAEHQIRVERFEVEWTGQSAGDLSGQADRHFRWQESGARHTAPAGGRATEQPAGPAPVRSPPRPGQSAGFDVIV